MLSGEEPERITIEADYEPLDPASISAQVTVITAAEIEAAAPRSAAEIVAPVLGVQLQRYGGITEPSLVTIRGSSPEQVLVLVNGKKMNSSQGGGVDFSTINPDDIERIEIIRGGGSAVYGESAFGGVINIITKSGYGKEFGTIIEYEGGSFDTHALSAQMMGGLGKEKAFDFFLSFRGMFTEGGYTYPDEHAEDGEEVRENTGGLIGDASFKTGWDINREAGLRLSLSGQLHEDEKGVPGLAEFPTASAVMRDRSYQGLLSFNYLYNPIAAVTLDISGKWQSRNYTDPEYYLGAVDDTHENTAFGTELTLQRGDDFSFLLLKSTAGYNYDFEYLESTGLLTAGGDAGEGTVTRHSHSGYARSDLHFFPFPETSTGRFTITPSIRYDGHRLSYPDGGLTRDDEALSWNVGLLVPFSASKKILIKGNAGTSYRLPTFDDLFWPATAFAVGNPDLEPEEAFQVDAGLIVSPFPFLTVEGVFFNQKVTNLIQWTPGPNGQWRPGNVGEALIRGVEAEIKTLFSFVPISSFLEVKGNYSYLIARDMVEDSATYGLQLPRRPFEKANVSAALSHLKGHSFRVEGRFVGFRYITAQNTKFLPSYFILDSALKVSVTSQFAVTLAVKNLLDTSYVDIREYPVPGREISFSGRLKL